MRFLSDVPQEVRLRFAHSKYLGALDEDMSKAALLLVTDDRMIECWNTLQAHADMHYRDANGGWAESFVATAANQFSDANRSRRNWMNLSLVEQAKWREKFDLTVEQLLELVRVGPWPPGLADRVVFKKDYDRLHGRSLDDVDAEHHSASEEEKVADEELPIDDPFFWGVPVYDLRHVLDALARDQLAAANQYRQTLKKPRDRGAGRVRFLQEMTNWCSSVCGQKLRKVVATTGEVVFDDPGINVRLVQTHTR